VVALGQAEHHLAVVQVVVEAVIVMEHRVVLPQEQQDRVLPDKPPIVPVVVMQEAAVEVAVEKRAELTEQVRGATDF